MDILEGILGGWGAVLSTILAVDQFRQRRRGQVLLTGAWNEKTDELQVEIVNVGTRPVTVSSIDVAYGEVGRIPPPLLDISATPFKLEDGEGKRWTLNRLSIAEARQTQGVEIGERNLVWVRAHLYGVGKKITPVAIDAVGIGAKGLYTPAEESIAADLFVGFSRDEVEKQRRGLNYRSSR